MTYKQQIHPRRDIFLHTFKTILIFCGIVVGAAVVEGIGTVGAVMTHLLFLTQTTFFWLLGACAIFDLSGAAFFVWTAEARAIRRYIRAVQIEQEGFHSGYMPLSVVPNVYKTSTTSHIETAQSQPQILEEFVQQQNGHFLLLGLPGGGKTIGLLASQYVLLERSKELIRGREKIPILLLMEDYNAVLKEDTSAALAETAQEQEVNTPSTLQPVSQLSLIDYLRFRQLPGMHYLRPYLKKLIAQKRILFLCDGLNDVDDNYLPALCQDLLEIMQDGRIRLVMTCRELDYHEQPLFASLVSNEYATEAVIAPLDTKGIENFVKHFMADGNNPGEANEFTPDQVTDLISATRLQSLCSNPFVLSTLLETIKGKQNDTRGLLLRQLVSQLTQWELERPKWQNLAFTKDDLHLFLSQVAYTACRIKSPNRISLDSSPSSTYGRKKKRTHRELAATLEKLLADPPIEEDMETIDEDVGLSSFAPFMITKMLRFAEEAALITISSDNILSFQHESVAEYFVAEYLYTVDEYLQQARLPFVKALITNVEDWKEPIRIWAGFSSQPMKLADHVAYVGLENFSYGYGYNALTLAILCIGVRWKQLQTEPAPVDVFPESLNRLLRFVVSNESNIDGLATTFNRCAQEGGVSVYSSILHLLRFKGLTDLLLKFDKLAVSKLLFEYLSHIIDKETYGAEVGLLKSTLGKLGRVVIPQAIDLSKPSSGLSGPAFQKHRRLRKAAIEILGRTHEQEAVATLIVYLREREEIRDEAINALIELGPTFALKPVLDELASHTPSPAAYKQWAALAVLEDFLATHPLDALSYSNIVERLLYVLSSAYEQPIQEQAKKLLFQEAQPHKPQWKKVIALLIQGLSDPDTSQALHMQDILVKVGSNTVPLLQGYLNQPRLPELVLARITEVLGQIPGDDQALASLIAAVGTPSAREPRYRALRRQVPNSIPPLIDLVLFSENSNKALEAFHILKEMSQECVMQVIQHLSPIVPERTQLLVQVLESTHDRRIIQPLLELLEVPQRETDTALAKVVIHALGQLPDKRSLLRLLELLKNLSYYEEASKALSYFGGEGLSELSADLIAALDNEQEKEVTRGVRNALSLMTPFPGQQLLDSFAHCSTTHAQQIMRVFRSKGETVAQFLVSHLCHQNAQIQYYVRQTLDEMEEQSIVQALLDANHKGCRSTIVEYLRKYPQSIPPLVKLLGDQQRGDAASYTLIDIGPKVIPSLTLGLNDQRGQQRTKYIIVKLIQQQDQFLPEVIRLFTSLSSPNEQSGYEALQDVLINYPTDVSTPALLDALESENLQVREGVVGVLIRLVRLDNAHSNVVLQELSTALKVKGRRSGARAALEQIGKLEQIGEKAIKIVDTLSQDEDREVKQVALVIMSNIGAPVLPFVYDYMNDLERKRDGEYVLRNMGTRNLKSPLVKLLASADVQDNKMALTLLLECVRIDASRPSSEQKMIPALLEHLQTTRRESVHLRMIAFLLLLPKVQVLPYLSQVLSTRPNPQTWLTPVFLLLGMEGDEAKTALIRLEQSSRATHSLHLEVVSILGMLEAHPIIEQYVTSSWENTRSSYQPGNALPIKQLEIAQHALGSLLVSGKWNTEILRGRQRRVEVRGESLEHEFYSVLLGESYVSRIEALRRDLRNEQELRSRETREYGEQIQNLQEKVKQTENRLASSARELRAKENEMQGLRAKLEKATNELGVSEGRCSVLEGQNHSLSTALQHLRQNRSQ